MGLEIEASDEAGSSARGPDTICLPREYCWKEAITDHGRGSDNAEYAAARKA